jgi:hypothetical protein
VTIRKQGGMTAIGWILVLALIAVGSLITLRLVPLYLEFYSVTASLKSLQAEPGMGEKAPAQITELLRRRLDVNDVRNVKRDNIRVRRNGAVVLVSVDYEVRVPMFGNVDAVAMFKREVEVPAR